MLGACSKKDEPTPITEQAVTPQSFTVKTSSINATIYKGVFYTYINDSLIGRDSLVKGSAFHTESIILKVNSMVKVRAFCSPDSVNYYDSEISINLNNTQVAVKGGTSDNTLYYTYTK